MHIFLALLLSIASSLTLAAAGPARPNVVIILTDDQGWGDVGMRGNTNLRTPNLDELASSGVVLDHFYVAPVCAPTRASLLTGRYHRRTGVRGVTRGAERMNLDEVTLADVFRRAGYATGAFGKWHNGSVYPYHPNGRGFEEFYGFCCGHWGHYFDPQLEHNGKPVQAEGFIADVFTEQAVDYIERCAAQDRPFLCWLAYCTPHSPFQVADRDWARIASRELSLTNRDREKEQETTTRAALALVENIDRNVGRLLASLAALQIREETIVIFLSDNGPNSWRWNGGLKGRKGSIHEGGVRVPFFLTWPGTVEPRRSSLPAAHIDLLPSLCGLCGIEPPRKKPLDGIDLSPLFRGEEFEWPERLLFSNLGKRISVRTTRYRADSGGLYDLQEDPGQRRNLAGEKPELHRSLKESMQQFLKETTPQTIPSTHHLGHPDAALTTLNAQEAKLEGKRIRFSSRHPNASWIENWTSTEEWPLWEVEVLTAGSYRVSLDYTCAPDAVGTELELTLGTARLPFTLAESFDPPLYEARDRVRRDESYDKPFKTLDLGTLELAPGSGELVLKALKKPGREVLHLRALRFERQ